MVLDCQHLTSCVDTLVHFVTVNGANPIYTCSYHQEVDTDVSVSRQSYLLQIEHDMNASQVSVL